jgi:hypothetical protein
MNVWVVIFRYDGEMSASTHLTQKGAYLTAIGDVLEFLGVDDEETATAVVNAQSLATGQHCESTDDLPPHEWDFMILKGMSSEDLANVFGSWAEYTWESYDYDIEINRTVIAA